MKVPYGSKLALYRLPDMSLADIVKRAAQEKVTGYIRVTTEKEELVDFYIFLLRGDVVGGYSESGKEQVFGDPAYTGAFYPFDKGLVDVRGLGESVVSLLAGNYPEMAVSTSTIPDIPEEERVPEDTRYLVIANMRIPQGDLLDFQLAVHVTDFWELLDDLEQRALTGYFRIFAEEDEAPRDGCVFFSGGKAVGALYESAAELKYGDEALFKILFIFSLEKGIIDFHELKPIYLKTVLKYSALKLSGTPQEVFHRIEEEELEAITKVRSYFGIPEGDQVISTHVRELAALEILLRTLKDRGIEGYLVLSSHRGAGIMIVQGGLPRAAFHQSGDRELQAGKALEAFMDQIQEETNVKIFTLSREEVEKALNRKEASIRDSDSVSEAIVHELGEDLFIEIKEAHRFKAEFERRRKKVSD
ncbi:MAG: DUF2226 domain-containing protein [Theionarchaea archaeon]|nr:DUF2226 domain-containing protein [Theionarchaea archaeon]MBU7036583.1 DUF2226 domain-containing protein [Theionarchaea archaeon]